MGLFISKLTALMTIKYSWKEGGREGRREERTFSEVELEGNLDLVKGI